MAVYQWGSAGGRPDAPRVRWGPPARAVEPRAERRARRRSDRAATAARQAEVRQRYREDMQASRERDRERRRARRSARVDGPLDVIWLRWVGEAYPYRGGSAAAHLGLGNPVKLRSPEFLGPVSWHGTYHRIENPWPGWAVAYWWIESAAGWTPGSP